jgi:hypothetical protein
MKRLAVVLLGIVCVAAVVYATTNQVTSVNIVGYNKITCPRDKRVLVSTAFESLDGSELKSADVFGNALPNGTSVHAYKPGVGYLTDNKSFLGWGTNITYMGGMGFWIEVPGTADEEEYEVVLHGQVPLAEAHTNYVYTGLNLLGYPYTASVLWTNTALAQSAVNGDELHVYDPDGGYTSYNKSFLGWGSANALVLTADMGFWYKTSAAAKTNIEVRPYNP